MRTSGRFSARNERGVTLAAVAVMTFMLLGMAALAVDYGMVKAWKAEAQRAADAAALAGASVFLESDPTIDKDAEARARAMEYATTHAIRNQAIVPAEVTIEPDLANEEVKVTINRAGLNMFFAAAFGTTQMGIGATATAHAVETGTTQCVMPVAIPDAWDNNDVNPESRNGDPEEIDEDDLWHYEDKDGDGYMDNREREVWDFDVGSDTYDQATTGYGTDFRNGLGGSNPELNKTNDYGRQITLMTLDPQDGAVNSNYYAWGFDEQDANSAQVVADKIKNPSCGNATVGEEYQINGQVNAGNGAQVGPISEAWDQRIGMDAGSWDDTDNTVEGSNHADWINNSGRVVIVALYDPVVLLSASTNVITFNNFARIWVDERPPGCAGASCKAPITGRFLGFVPGNGIPGGTTGPLVKRLQLIK